jgi:hypothetical protein
VRRRRSRARGARPSPNAIFEARDPATNHGTRSHGPRGRGSRSIRRRKRGRSQDEARAELLDAVLGLQGFRSCLRYRHRRVGPGGRLFSRDPIRRAAPHHPSGQPNERKCPPPSRHGSELALDGRLGHARFGHRRRSAASSAKARAASVFPSTRWSFFVVEGPIAHPPDSPVSALGGGTQWLFKSHTLGATQSWTELHVVLHCPPAHKYGSHGVDGPPGRSTEWPSAPQVDPVMQLPSLHVPAFAHSAFEVQLVLHWPVVSSHT